MNAIMMCSGKGQFASEKNNGLVTIGWDQIVAMAEEPESRNKKDARWLIPSSLISRRFREQEMQGTYYMLWVDLDKDVPDITTVSSIVGGIVGDVEYLIYLTSSSTKENSKCRVLVPLVGGLKPKEWRICQELLNNFLQNNGLIPDRVNQRHAQLCFLPNKGDYYEYVHNIADNSQRLEPLGVFNAHFQELLNEEALAEQAAKAKIEEAKRKRAEWLEKGYESPIDWFNQHYSVEEILINNCYEQKGCSFRHPDSGSGSFSASIDPSTGRVHSLSFSDKLYTGGGGIGAHDAFSCFMVLNHDGNMDKAIVGARTLKETHETETLEAIFDQLSTEQSKPDPDIELVEKLSRHADLIRNRQDSHEFKLIYADDLLSTPEPLEWLIQEYLPPNGLGFVNGEPASGKSFLAIDWCCSIATEKQWRGKKVAQGGAVILAGEGQFGIKRRLKAWEVDNKVDLSSCPIAVSDIGAAMIDDKSLKSVEVALDDFVRRYGSLHIIVIDTLHRNLGAGDENSAQDMAVYFHNLDYLRMKYDCLIITVHHTGHGDSSRARGSSSIKAAVDVEYMIKHKKESGVSTVSCTKMKDGPKAFGFSFKLHSVKLPWIGADGCEETSAVLRETTATKAEKESRMTNATELVFEQLAKLAFRKENKTEVVGEAEWRKSTYTVMTHDNQDSKRKAYDRAKKDLQKLGLIDVLNNTYAINHEQLNDRAADIVADYMSDPFAQSTLLEGADSRTGQDI